VRYICASAAVRACRSCNPLPAVLTTMTQCCSLMAMPDCGDFPYCVPHFRLVVPCIKLCKWEVTSTTCESHSYATTNYRTSCRVEVTIQLLSRFTCFVRQHSILDTGMRLVPLLLGCRNESSRTDVACLQLNNVQPRVRPKKTYSHSHSPCCLLILR
jgi:hypothetical protein